MLASPGIFCTFAPIMLHFLPYKAHPHPAQTTTVAGIAAEISFFCFCKKLYFISNFKDFHTQAPGC
ncbi:hypothetical protein DF182_00840 [Chitinophaga flava]|uniref:Uncharacterized protein n=2 Tax=Chitinophaga flava TaxID=2259036 RepID=A0A365XYY1_9BACT|nr:hypothetical protein DF182_00840 [Chitinophaga flava]